MGTDCSGENGPSTKARRLLLCGWGAAAAEVLSEIFALHRDYGIVVLCMSHSAQADDCDLRGVCEKLGFECLLTDSDEELFSAAEVFKPDLLISASYRKKLRANVLSLCKDAINFHPSLLPRHRGCWSGFWSIFEGDAETGVTCHRMVEEFDKGLVLHQEIINIDDADTAVSLYKRLLPVTAQCARRILQMFVKGALPVGEEQRGEASYHYRRLPFGGVIQPEWQDEKVERFIRAMHFPPFDGAAVETGGPNGEPQRVLVDSLEHYRALKSSNSGGKPDGN